LVRELLQILSKPNMQALLYCHDKIASRDFVPQLAPVDDVKNDELDDGGHMTVIQFIKANEPLVYTYMHLYIYVYYDNGLCLIYV